MKPSLVLATGAFLAAFGTIWGFFAVVIVQVLYGEGGGSGIFIGLELVSVTLIPLGLAMLVYGLSLRSPSASEKITSKPAQS